MEMVEPGFRVKALSGIGVLVLADIPINQLAKGIIVVAGLCFAVTAGKGNNTARFICKTGKDIIPSIPERKRL